MSNFSQPPIALDYNFESGKMGDLEDGVVIDVELSGRHDAFIADMPM